ncbi:MAG: DedA family protein, partial [Thermoplasmata archaeon]|nr:DedA family protein [Thermoplasmata archaeon]
ALVALMIVESFGFPPLPSEIILPFAGFLVFSGTYSWPGAVAAALVGALIGSYLAYGVGRYGRHFLERDSGWIRLDPKHLRAMDGWFARHGEGTVLTARLLPIVRSYISYPAGTSRMEPVRFGAYTLIGAVPFTLALMYAGFLLGKNWIVVQSYFHIADYFAAVALVILLAYVGLRWRGLLSEGFPPRWVRPETTPGPIASDPSPSSDPRPPSP